MTGGNEIDIDQVVNDWNHLWGIYQYAGSFRLIKAVRKDSELTSLSLTLTLDQADKIIRTIPLTPETTRPFRFAVTWKKQ